MANENHICPGCLVSYSTPRCPICLCVLPTKRDIAVACLRIQATWSRAEERKRRAIHNQPAEVPLVGRAHDHMVRRDCEAEARK